MLFALLKLGSDGCVFDWFLSLDLGEVVLGLLGVWIDKGESGKDGVAL